MATLRQVRRALKTAGLTVSEASEADWIDEAVWLGDTTLVGVTQGQIVLLTRTEENEGVVDEEQGVWDQPDDGFVRKVRHLVLRDVLARALGAGLLTAGDVVWAAQRALVVRQAGYVSPSGMPSA